MVNKRWLQQHFPAATRYTILLFQAENVLEPNVLKIAANLYKNISNIEDENGVSIWKKRCQKIPIFSKSGISSMCPDASSIARVMCAEFSILELFIEFDGLYDYDNIETASLAQILKKVNKPQQISAVTGRPFRPENYLGGVERQGDQIVGAKAMMFTMVQTDSGEKPKGDEENLMFEKELLSIVNTNDNEYENGLLVYPFTKRSFDDVSKGNSQKDLDKLAAGYLLIFCYACINLGKFNRLQHRFWLTVIGIGAIGLGMVSSYGLCLLLGVVYSEMNAIMPFLMLGIGVDDMFVIVQAWETLDDEERNEKLIEKFGLTMKHAGVAITITSVTDLLAFAIGASTAIPSLTSFCIYATFGILFIYFYQTTFFLAWFSLDERRLESSRDACLCCWKKEDWQLNECSQNSLMTKIFSKFGDFLSIFIVKLLVVLFTLIILGFGIWGAITIQINFDFKAFIGKGSYLRNFFDSNEKYFPNDGLGGKIYFTDLNYTEDLKSMDELIKNLSTKESDARIKEGSVISWIDPFIFFVTKKRGFPEAAVLLEKKSYSEEEFSEDLSVFLFSSAGKPFIENFKFEKPLVCGKSAPRLLLSSVSYTHVKMFKSLDSIAAMNAIFNLVDQYNFSSKVFATSEHYSNFITMDILVTELTRNILLALVVVFLCTLFFIGHFLLSLIVLFNVLFTIVNVAGFSNFWDVSVDVPFVILMTISIGLCVDYSAHVAHGFAVEKGSRNQRMKNTLVKVGPAVLNGGLSTFFAFVLLVFSSSFVFFTFFKIFFFVVLFGLYHGLVFLPVLLYFGGPTNTTEETYNQSNIEVKTAGVSNDAFEKNVDDDVFVKDGNIDNFVEDANAGDVLSNVKSESLTNVSGTVLRLETHVSNLEEPDIEEM